MLRRESRFAIMFAFLFGFASIKAEEIPEGIMPKRAVAAGTGGQSSSPNQQSTSTPVQQQSSTQPANQQSSQNNNNNGQSSQNNNNNNGGSSTLPNSVSVTHTNANGQKTTSHIATNSVAAGGKKKNTDSDVKTGSGKKHKVKVGSKTIDPATLKHKTTVKHPLVAQHTKESVHTSFWTSNGHVYSSVYTTENVVKSTTGYAKATIAPSLANQGGSGDNLSTSTKKIIGGVVGGVGGAIVIGGLAFVAWRLWGKKKRGQQELQDEHYDSTTDSISAQKSHRASNQTFETEPYSNPNGSVNKASNF